MKSLDDGLVLFDETIAVNVRNEARKRFELLRLNVCRIHIWARGGDGTQMTEVQVGESGVGWSGGGRGPRGGGRERA